MNQRARKSRADSINQKGWSELRQGVEDNLGKLKRVSIEEAVEILLSDGVSCNARLLRGLESSLHVWKDPFGVTLERNRS